MAALHIFWDELVEEFLALGGALENVHLADGPLGRGLFVTDSTRPFLIRIPQNLLVKSSDIVFEDNVLRVLPSAALSPRERQFYEHYYAHLSWGGGGRAEIERIFDQTQMIPAELREKLMGAYRLAEWFADPTDAVVQSQFIQSRKIGHQAREVMMPFIELANHGNERAYEGDADLILQGTARDEITVSYSSCDAYSLFRSWGFSSPQDIAHSFPMRTAIGQTPLLIECNAEETSSPDRPGYPTLTREDAAVKLNVCMVGNSRFPRFCRGNFRHVLRSAGFHDVDETFDRIRQNNQLLFLSLLADLEPLAGPMVQSLRQVARFQLEALTHCYGARETPLARRTP